MTNKQRIGKFLIIIFLVAILVIRLLITDQQSKWIGIINYIGVFVALVDLFFRNYSSKDKFHVINGIAIIMSIFVAIGAALLFTGTVVLGSKGNDSLTILALLISLPSDLYSFFIQKYINS